MESQWVHAVALRLKVFGRRTVSEVRALACGCAVAESGFF
jgi:hypothetical protein